MLTILIVCTGNSCRSVLGEALFNHFGQGRIQAFSAGSQPLGKINPNAIATLQRHGISGQTFKSQSWQDFSEYGIDLVITVCDNAGAEECPVYLQHTQRVHWGLIDPSHINGNQAEIIAAFEQTYRILEKRVNKVLALPFETMTQTQLMRQLESLASEF